MIRGTLYLLAALGLSSYALAMEEWEPALTTLPSVQEEEPCSLLEQLPVELLKMVYDKLDPESKKVFLTLNKRLSEIRCLFKKINLKNEAGIPCLSSLPELEALKIACELSPQGILQLKPRLGGLRVLDLSDNKLWTVDFIFLAPALTNLQQLSLRDCTIQSARSPGYLASFAMFLLGSPRAHEELSYLKGLTQLQQLDLNGCNHISPSNIGRVLRVAQMQAPDVGPDQGIELEALAGLTQLRKLGLRHMQVTGPSLRHLAGLTQLEELDVSRTFIDSASLEYLLGLTRLRQLNLSRNDVSDAGIRHLMALTQLRQLDLSETQVTNEGLRDVAALTQLRQLDISSTFVSNEGLEYLGRLTLLQALGLSLNARLLLHVHENLPALTGLRQLQRLDLSGSYSVGDATLAALVEAFPLLQQLNLSSCLNVGNEGLSHLVGLIELQVLDLYNCFRVSDEGIPYLLGLTKLRQLRLSGTQVGNAGLRHLAGLTNLRELSLSGTQVSDEGMRHLTRLTQLQELDVFDIQVSDRGLQHLRELTQLRKLVVCWRISDAGMAALKAALPDLEIVKY